MTTLPAVPLLGRHCNPYGAETGGPRHLMGGLYGPASARADPVDLPGLPENVMQGEHICPQLAQVTVRMVCRCGHTGEPMELCSWHDEVVFRGEMVAGTIRRVKSVVRVRGHYEEISRRQCGACTRCLYPGMYAEQHKSLFAWQGELAYLCETGQRYSDRAKHAMQKIEDIVAQFDEGNATGTIHRCPMTLVPVS